MNWVLFYCIIIELCVLLLHYRPRTLGGETLLSPGDQERQDGETSTTTNSHIPTHPGKPDREE